MIRNIGWLVALWIVVLSSAAAASPLPLEGRLNVGRPAKPTRVLVENTPEGVVISVGSARETVGGWQATEASIESVSLAGGAAVVLVSLQNGTYSRVAIAASAGSRITFIWNDRIGLHGDPGERRGYFLIREDHDGDGVVDLGIAERHETVRDCAGATPRVRVRWIDPRNLTLLEAATSVEAVVVPSESLAIDALATAPPGMPDHPVLPAMRGRWVAGPEVGEPLTELPTGSEVLERSAAVGTRAGAPTRAVVAVSAPGLHVRHVSFDIDSEAAGHPAALMLRFDTGAWFHVTLPAAAGTRRWITLPIPVEAQCLEFAAASSAGRTAALPDLSGLQVFTELDEPEGLKHLVARVITDDSHGTEAAALLVSLGDQGTNALRAAWETLGNRGQRRAVVAFAARTATSAAARAGLALATGHPEQDIRERAMSALLEFPTQAFHELATLAAESSARGTLAAKAIGDAEPADAIPLLFRLIEAPEGPNRPAVRNALASALARSGEAADALVATWLQETHSDATLASVLLAVSASGTARESALAVWQTLSQRTLEFPEHWRVLLAASDLAASAAVDSWLAEEAATPGVAWMLRDVALMALKKRNASTALEAARTATQDESPRVRATAIHLLGTDANERAKLAASLKTEPWPMVRVALIEEVVGLPGSHLILREAIADRAVPVRIAAIDALIALEDRAAWPLVAKRLADNNEWPAVSAAAVRFAGALCIAEATPDLRNVLKRGLKPEAWAPDLDLAMDAIGVLGQLGTDEARRLLIALQRPDQTPAIQETARRAAVAPTCQAPQNGSNSAAE